jgi:translation elongation factor EF-1alpha
MAMQSALTILLAIFQFAIAGLAIDSSALAQSKPRQIAVKNGESIEIGPIYWVINCRSVMIGLPEIEVLEGPPNVALTIKEGQVLPRSQGCAAKVQGGTLVLNAKDVTEQTEAKLTYRLKYKTKDGNRQTGNTYIVSLFP